MSKIENKSHLNEVLSFMRNRAVDALIGRERVNKPAFNNALREILGETKLLKEPYFEATKYWKVSEETYQSFVFKDCLNQKFLKALSKSKAGKFIQPTAKPYLHQATALEEAKKGKSLIVTSGTGSGKTETFLLPVINDIVERIEREGNQPGIQAIIIYPLNALIESQRERLKDWLDSLYQEGIEIKYALYNGATPYKKESRHKTVSVRIGKQADLGKTECASRPEIQQDKPAILITNITMLEYMLLRPRDQKLIQGSEGKLKWIILDEAHSYIGSQAAELALLLRRIRIAFHVQSKDTRIIATSATVGTGKENNRKLKKFIGDLAGYNAQETEAKVTVIHGETEKPLLPKVHSEILPDLESFDPSYQTLAGIKPVQKLVSDLRVEDKTYSLSEVGNILSPQKKLSEAEVLNWLELLAQAKENSKSLLSWRAHHFHRSVGGIYACLNPKCTHKQFSLKDEQAQWGWGKIYLEQREKCDCGTLCLEVAVCGGCGSLWLKGQESNLGRGIRKLSRRKTRREDEFKSLEDYHFEDEDEVLEETLKNAEEILVFDPKEEKKADILNSDETIKQENDFLDQETNKLTKSQKENSIPIKWIEDRGQKGICCGNQYSKSPIKGIFAGSAYLAPLQLPYAVNALGERAKEGESSLPLEGRKGLTFTDSRQGVAKMAMRLQSEAERSLIRSFIYHFVHQASEKLNEAEIRKAQRDLKNAQEGIKDALNEAERQLYQKDKEKAEALLNQAVISKKWEDLWSAFSKFTEVEKYLAPLSRNRLVRVLGKDASRLQENLKYFAQILLLKELAFRPTGHGNNLENLGLVKIIFPKMEAAIEAGIFREGERLPEIKGMGKEDWKNLVYAGIDLVFRKSLAVKMQGDQKEICLLVPSLRWGASPAIFNQRDYSDSKGAKYRWPSLGQATQFNRVLDKFTALKNIPSSRKLEILNAVWELIINHCASHLEDDQRRFQIDFEKAEIAPVTEAYIDPKTRKITSYLVGNFSPFGIEGLPKKIKIPQPPYINSAPLLPEQRAENEKWFKTDPQVKILREKLLWTDIAENIISYAPFYRAQEHSAQISRTALKKYEEDFEKGYINLLNCSTTMEMGVDIAEVQVVANTNVPPSLSNYRQRIGRAGRRREDWAFGFTYCRANPFDESAFRSPQKYLATDIPAPSVNLTSKKLIERHINSLFLRLFIIEKTQGQGQKLHTSIGHFMGVSDKLDKKTSVEEVTKILEKWRRNQTSYFAKDFKVKLEDKDFIAGAEAPLKELLKGTEFASATAGKLAEKTLEAFENFSNKWREEHKLLREELSKALEMSWEIQNTRYIGLLKNRLNMMAQEPMLAALSQGTFLPSHGFPIDVVALTFPSYEIAETFNQQTSQEEEKISKIDGKASRSLDVALREYAPGKETIIDGISYLSGGIKPAWRQEFGKSPSSLEDIRTYWACESCGQSGMERLSPKKCSNCSSPIEKKEVIRPKGFIATSIHTQEMTDQSVALPLARFSLKGEWKELAVSDAGKIRVDSAGEYFLTLSGKEGEGYALCSKCGRMKSLPKLDNDNVQHPKDALKNHYPLEAIDEYSAKASCSGNDEEGAIFGPVSLIANNESAIFELKLVQEEKKEVLLAIAGSIREAFCKIMGIEADEIGVSYSASSVFLYDKASGGAGLSSQLNNLSLLNEVLKSAEDFLNCPDKCEKGCSACLMRNDIAGFGIDLAREEALLKLKEILQKMVLKEEDKLFGTHSVFAGRDALEWLENFAENENPLELSLFLAEKWPEDEKMRKILRILSSKQIKTKLILPQEAVQSSLDISLLQKLLELKAGMDTEIFTLNLQDYPKTLMGQKPLLGLLTLENEVQKGIARLSDDSLPDWQIEDGVLIEGETKENPTIAFLDLNAHFQNLLGKEAKILQIGAEFNGEMLAFGKKFWQEIKKQFSEFFEGVEKLTIEEIKKISYTDRYLASPLTVGLFYQIFKNIPAVSLSNYCNWTKKLSLEMKSLEVKEKGSSKIWDNWETDSKRDSVLKQLFPNTHLMTGSVAHDREFKIILNNGQSFHISFGQGMGAWHVVASYSESRFPLSDEPAVQYRLLSQPQWKVERKETGKTTIAVWKEETK